jgi:hypothetical protein
MTASSQTQPHIDLTDPESFNAVLKSASEAAIKSSGVDGSGAFSHYNTLTTKNRIYGESQADFVRFITERFDASRPIHELGDGGGIPGIALFSQGYDCVNLCANSQRSKYSQSLASAVKATGLTHRYRILKDRFPSAVTDLLLKQEPGALLISHDSVNKAFSDNEGAVIQRASIYPDIVMNVARFVRPRDLETEQTELIDMFLRRKMMIVDQEDFSPQNRLVWLRHVTD